MTEHAQHTNDNPEILKHRIAELTAELTMYRKLADSSSEEEAKLFMQEVHFLAVMAAGAFGGEEFLKELQIPEAFMKMGAGS
jgi:hypothetical protein